MTRQLVLVGGGHSHLFTLGRLGELTGRGITVTLVTPDRHHYYSGMGPGMFGGFYHPDAIRIDVQALAEQGGAHCIVSAATGLDPKQRVLSLADGRFLSYDILSLNVGSETTVSSPPVDTTLPVKPIANLVRARELLLSLAGSHPPRLLVVGGGAAGVEVAGNGRRLLGQQGTVTLAAGGGVLPSFPGKARNVVLRSFAARGITILEGTSVERWEKGRAVFANGRTVDFDLALLATGVTPPPALTYFCLPLASDGSLLVNRFLQAETCPEILAGGDCITFAERPLQRVGVYAVRQGPVLFRNIKALAAGEPLTPFSPQRSYLQLLNLGDGTAIFVRNGFTWHGRLAWQLKDAIDRRFVDTYRLTAITRRN
ncbi:MAG: pyridine nucleotide-disulfide oxidoreductase [Desulfuromonadales bacterium]|nr:MAG: pyridine nucleotide-disulfide oxidoreductase [Desulfuromonadales bacterium]